MSYELEYAISAQIQSKIIQSIVRAERIGTLECGYRKTIRIGDYLVENYCGCGLDPYPDMPIGCPTGEICRFFYEKRNNCIKKLEGT